MPTEHLPIPNHHADHAGFRGLSGLAAAVSFLGGRDSDAHLAARLVGLAPADRVVDIGCGPGVAARHAASIGAKVIGVDPAAVMLRVARWRRTKGVTWRIGAAEDLPVDDRWATVAWSLATVHHWKNIEAGLDEVARILAPGGRFTVLERRISQDATGHASHGWTDAQADSFAARCVAHGLVDVTTSSDNTTRGSILTVTAHVAVGMG